MPPRKKTTKKSPPGPTPVDAIVHPDKRSNLPTADAHDLVTPEVEAVPTVRYPRDPSLDPQLVWRGKDEQDSGDLEVPAPPLFIQEKIDPRVLIENLRDTAREETDEPELSLFDTFDGLDGLDLVEFYEHEANWSNRMILGDSLQVMSSLAEREGLRGQVQAIYFDPPYGIKFGSNWQMSAKRTDVRDGRVGDITREAEQVRAFRDTWGDGIHSYLSFLRDRTQAARDLLTQSGVLFLQIGDDNVHRVRCVLDEVFGAPNQLATIVFKKTPLLGGAYLDVTYDTILVYARDREHVKYRQLFVETAPDMVAFPSIQGAAGSSRRLTAAEKRAANPPEGRLFRTANLTSQSGGETTSFPVEIDGRTVRPSRGAFWKTNAAGMKRLRRAGRISLVGNTLTYLRYQDDFAARALTAWWDDTVQSTFATENLYAVQTYTKVIQRCLLMATDPGDLVLDPTCGAGTTAFVAEQWGRRWITIDTSRVAMAIARSRLMGARFPAYVLESERHSSNVDGSGSSQGAPGRRGVAGGFVLKSVPRITLKSITTNAEIDEIWDRYADELAAVSEALGRDPSIDPDAWSVPADAESDWIENHAADLSHWLELRSSLQADIDAAIARSAEQELLLDQAEVDNSAVRVAGPFTVETLAPHRAASPIMRAPKTDASPSADLERAFRDEILANLQTSGIQNGTRAERLTFSHLDEIAAVRVHAIGEAGATGEDAPRFSTAVSIGPQYGTVGATFVKEAAREAMALGGTDLLCVLGFSFDANVALGNDDIEICSEEFGVAGERSLGRLRVLLVRMNTDLLGGEELKRTPSANLFMAFGRPDVDLVIDGSAATVALKGVDIYDPVADEIRSDDTDKIALWMIDTNYNGESFFVRHCYFTGGIDPYKRLKTALRADIDEEAWASLYRTESRPFPLPQTGKIAVKVINDYGDEVMQVFDVPGAEAS